MKSFEGRMASSFSVLKQLPYEKSSTLYLLSTIGVISIFLLLKLTRTRRNKSNNLPPSPPKLPLIGNLHQLGRLPHRSFHELSKKYGSLMFLQLGQIPTLVISSADTAKEITKNHDIIFSSRPQVTAAKIFVYRCKDVAFSPYSEEWRQKRKICVLELLSLKRVKSFQSIRQEEVVELVNSIRESCATSKVGSVINLSEMMIAASNNIVSRCVLGQKYDAPKDGRSNNFGDLGRKLMKHFADFCVGDFYPNLGWVDVLRGLIPEFKTTFAGLEACFDELIEEHKRMKKNNEEPLSIKKDFVEILLQVQEDSVLDFQLTGEAIKAILADMFVGGSDTTSTTLEWTFAELLKNPNVMKKAQEEVRRVVGRKSKVEENDVNQMNYLHCVIKESLRLHPPLPLLVPRETLSGVEVKGYDIPPKTRVFFNVWGIQRDPELWENPEDFLPERFENNQVDFKGQDFQFLPFGTGRRGCPGISFGLTSTEYILANLLYWFDWKLCDKNGQLLHDVDMSELCGLTVTKKVPLHVQPIPYYSVI
ncbi:cytochrome P450 71A1 [Arachis ipaensis]|uniref:cytochrome P450 71A1 n=1 Tax=Arachis ipaensis TaxID=130454 RepID=UPI000A2B1B87|nr:cytochrome P450 71A1 [Arachis ipaensis]XP_025641481.1 cytochrome P450 71A1 [Arachis hypogaea]